jgi:hypothetical protein
MPREEDTVGFSSLQHNVDDLVSRGQELFQEARRAVDRPAGQRETASDTDVTGMGTEMEPRATTDGTGAATDQQTTTTTTGADTTPR